MACAWALSGCGEPLGAFRVADVRLVDGDVLNRIDPDLGLTSEMGQMLRLHLLSATNLTMATQTPTNLYIDAARCGSRSDDLFAVGPYYDDKYPWIRGEEAVRVTPDGEQVTTMIGGANRQPARDPRSGLFSYTVYVAVARPARTGANLAAPAYNLAAAPTSLCLSIHEVGYWLRAPRSDMMTVPRQLVVNALLAAP